MQKTVCLGIESTAHTFGVGILKGKKILANVRSMYKPESGGIVPHAAKEHHLRVSQKIIKEALDQARISEQDIDIVAYSAGPGLPPCLRVGFAAAKALAEKLSKPLIPVNHAVSHIEIGKLTSNFKDPVMLYVSGGNTQVLTFTEGKYRILGSTQDIAIGNALDKFARAAGIPHPGGPKVMELAKKGKYLELPYVVKGMDVSFSGIVTKATSLLKKARLEDLCFSLQETCFSMLVEVTERAVAHTEKNEVLLAGGVAANARLREMMEIMCRERGAKFAVVPSELAGDQGAMIAWTGILVWNSKQIVEPDIYPRWKTDEVEVTWIR